MTFPKRVTETLPKAKGGIFAVRFHANGRNLLVGGADRAIRLYNPFTKVVLHTFTNHAYQVLSLATSTSHDHFASCGGDRAIFLWDLSNTKLLHKFEGPRGHAQRVNDVTFAGEELLVSGSYDSTVKVWDLRSRSNRAVQTMNDASDSVSAVRALPSSAQIFTGSIDGCVRKYDVRMGMLSTDKLPAPVSSISLTRDQNCVLAACLDSSMWLLDKSNGEILSNYKGHKNRTFCLDCAVAFDDATVFCGSEDGSFYCWDIVEGGLPEHANLPPGRSSPVSALETHPSKNLCVSGTHDGDLYIWK